MSQKFGFRIWQFMQSIFLDKCQLGGANKSRGDHCNTAAPQTHPQSNYFKKQKCLDMKSTFPGASRTSCLSKIKGEMKAMKMKSVYE